MKESLRVHLVQSNLAWENPEANRAHFSKLLSEILLRGSVVVLPEMFNTGFSMMPQNLAEAPNGPTVQWMLQEAANRGCIVCGSLMIHDEGNYFNRLYWVQPDGQIFTYNKRHLFGLAGEDKVYTAGEKRVVVQVNGWRIALSICYDLRFPVWLRQQQDTEYDVLLVTANWPERRAEAWNTLLKARAIENQCYVLGVNRCGEDGNGLRYQGDTQIVDPLGLAVAHAGPEAHIIRFDLQADVLKQTRQQLPFLRDKDDFMIL